MNAFPAQLSASDLAVRGALVFASALVGFLAGVNPLFAIAGAMATAFVLVAFVNLAIGLSCFTVLAFFESTLPAASVLSISKVAGLVLAASWLARLATSSDARESFFAAHPQGTLLLLVFLGWGAVSITWSDTSQGTLVDLSRYLLNFVLAIVVYTAVRERRHVKWMIGVWVAGTALTAVYGLVTTPSVGAEAVRASSSVGDANTYAAVLVAGLVLALGGAIATHQPILRIAGIGVAGLALLGFVFTGSRSGVLALGTVLVAGVVLGGRWRGRVLAASIMLGIAAILTFAAFAPADIKQRIAETTPGQVPDTEGRLTLWQVAGRMVEDRPIQGVGLGSFQTSAPNYVLQPGLLTRTDQIIDTPKVAHNIYLQTIAEEGIIGLILFLLLLGFWLRCGLLAARNFARVGDREMEILARALVVALIGILTADFFVSDQFNKLLWLLLGLGPAMLAISKTGDAGDAQGSSGAQALASAEPA